MKQVTKKFMIKKLNIEEKYMHPDMNLKEDLDLGHFDILDFGDVIEEEFDCWVKLGEKNDWETVGDVANYIDKLVEEKEKTEAEESEQEDVWGLEAEELSEDEIQEGIFVYAPRKARRFIRKTLNAPYAQRRGDTKISKLVSQNVLIEEIKQEFKEELGLEQAEKMETLKDLIDYLKTII